MYGEIYYAFYRSQVITLGKRDRSRVKNTGFRLDYDLFVNN